MFKMTDKTRQAKSYTPEFRESAVQLAIESEKSVSVVAKELNVNVNTLHTWISKYTRPGKEKQSKTRTDEELV